MSSTLHTVEEWSGLMMRAVSEKVQDATYTAQLEELLASIFKEDTLPHGVFLGFKWKYDTFRYAREQALKKDALAFALSSSQGVLPAKNQSKEPSVLREHDLMESIGLLVNTAEQLREEVQQRYECGRETARALEEEKKTTAVLREENSNLKTSLAAVASIVSLYSVK